MNIIFNELSFLPLTSDEFVITEKFLVLLKTLDFAKANYGFNHMVFPTNIGSIKVTTDKTFYDWVYSLTNQSSKNKILSCIKKPFGEDILAETNNELNKYYYQNSEQSIPETYCNGLAVSYIKNELSSSISLNSIWDETTISFQEFINDALETKMVFVPNISQEIHFDVASIKQFVEYSGNIQLIETNIKPMDKPIALRDDHGKDKLLSFSKKVVQSKYVLSVINSLPFNPKCINLIKEIYSDGKIEIVLYWEDKGIGIIIQTTGRNYRETEAIGELLKKEFDK